MYCVVTRFNYNYILVLKGITLKMTTKVTETYW